MMKLYENKAQCCGCGACSNSCPKQCITMIADEEGFKYPVIDHKNCLKCLKCIKVCPMHHSKNDDHSDISQYYTAQHKDDQIIMESTSGGVFSALADAFLAQGGIVYGCVYNETMQAIHIGSEKSHDLRRMRGSKYVQSDMQDCYVQIKKQLNEGKNILFTGTPCQVAAVKTFLGKNYDNLLLVEVLCHGVPSPKLFASYIAYLENKHHGKVVNYEFRNKKIHGWGSEHRSYYEIARNGKIERYRPLLTTAYSAAFYWGINLRPSCYECPYATPKRISDITIGDFWGFWRTYKRHFPKGISIVALNSQKGKMQFNLLSQVMVLDPVTFEQAAFRNAPFIKPVTISSIRNRFYQQIEGKKYQTINRLLFLNYKYSKRLTKSIYRRFISTTFKRSLQ
jgi:NAD-dependent dihydropyrimidine dehydrogenase PreA subunit